MRSSANEPPGDSPDEDVAALKSLDRAALAARWRSLTGSAPPKRATAKLLALALAYEIQLLSSEDARRDEAAIEKALARSARSFSSGKPARRLAPGARLLREWRGRTLVVDVVEGGFVFEGAKYWSLSKIACEITGVARNGLTRPL